MNDSTAKAASGPGPPNSPIVRNVGMILATAILIGFWFWRYTPWQEEVTAILGLGGALAWVAMFLRIIPEDKTKEFQNALFNSVFLRKTTFLLSLAFFVAAALFLSNFAAIEIEPFELASHRAAFVYPTTPAADNRSRSGKIAEEDFKILSPRESLRFLVPLWGHWQSHFVVKVSGYPDLSVSLRPWQKLPLSLPASFRRPVVLLRPGIKLLNQHTEALPLKVTVNDQVITNIFDGHPVWIGCDSDVAIPKPVQQSLQSELRDTPAAPASLEKYWAYPKLDFYCFPNLKAGDRIVVELRRDNGQIIRSELDVAPVQPTTDFLPQIVELNLP